ERRRAPAWARPRSGRAARRSRAKAGPCMGKAAKRPRSEAKPSEGGPLHGQGREAAAQRGEAERRRAPAWAELSTRCRRGVACLEMSSPDRAHADAPPENLEARSADSEERRLWV